MKPYLLITLTVGLGLSGMLVRQAQGQQPGKGKLAFVASGTNEFAFDTGVLKGKLRAGGKSKGLSEVIHLPTGVRLDASMGLFGHYRVFSANHRYDNAAWEWPSGAKLRPDGSVEVHWPAAEDRPFELSALYRWAAPDTLDLATSVLARTNLAKFESFLASYFAEGFTNSCVLVRSNGQPVFVAATQSGGTWQAFPRDDQAVSIIKDGRWTFPPSPVDWAIQPRLAKPLGMRRCPANSLQALIMSPLSDSFAVLTPFEAEGHRSMYLSLMGKDLKPGETARARARLIIQSNLDHEAINRLYSTYLRLSW
jgi:hypothetical protein